MKNLTKLEAELILLTYDDINTGNIEELQILQAFQVLPVKNSGLNNLARIRAINSYVIHNNENLINMTTTLVDNQSDQNEVSTNIATPAGVEKPKVKRKYKARRKSRAKAKGRSKK